MGDKKFKYFRDPGNFAYKITEVLPCSVCGDEGLWFDGGGFVGINQIECICDDCLFTGKLVGLEIETNQAIGGTDKENEEIVHRTPSLPTWQDLMWPYVDDQYCVFECIASKEDFVNFQEFQIAFSADEQEQIDLSWLWNGLPERKVKNYVDGNSNVSVYLFTCGAKKYCVCDAN